MSSLLADNVSAGLDYGERFRQLRSQLWKGRSAALAERLGLRYSTSLYNIEALWRIPNLPTIGKHAEALGCRPWELLKDVETEYDMLRALNDRDPTSAEREWRVLIANYEKSTGRRRQRGKKVEPVREVGETRPGTTGRHRRRGA